MCEGGGRDDGVGVVRGGGGVGGAGGPSMGPEPGAHLRVAQHAGQQGRHQHGRQDDHQHVQAAHFDWQPLWRWAGLGEGQISRSPHSHWSGSRTHACQIELPQLFPFPFFLPYSLASSFVFLLCLSTMFFGSFLELRFFFFFRSIWDSFDGGGLFTFFS